MRSTPAIPVTLARDIAGAAGRLIARVDARLALFGLLAAIQLALIWNHEPWEDELQALLIARDSHSLADWYWNFRYEGHPPLWHLVLKLFLVFADPAAALHLALSVTALAILWLLVVVSPFPVWFAAMLSTGYFVSFEYGTIARGYSLGVALLFAVIAFRPHRWAWLLVALLPQAGVQTIVLSAVCVYLMWDEERWSWPGAALWIGGVGVALIWMVPAADFTTPSSINMQKLSFVESLGRTLYQSGIALMPVDWAGHLLVWAQLANPPALVLTAIGLLLPGLTMWMLRGQPRLALLVGLFCAFTFALSMKVYPLSGRHFGLVLMLTIACLWIAMERKMRLSRVAIGVFGVQACGGMVAAAISATTPFTVGRALTDWVGENGYGTAAFVPDYPLYGLPASAYLGKPSVDVTGACLQTFVRWRFSPADLPAGQTLLSAALRAAAAADGRALLVMHSEFDPALPRPEGVTLKLARRFEGSIQNPKVVVYEVTTERGGGNSKPLPVCPPFASARGTG